MRVKRLQKSLGIMAVTLAVFVSLVCPSMADSNLIDFSKTVSWTSGDINANLESLVSRYPDLLELERIGTSVGGKPIVAVRMTSDMDGYRLNELHLRTMRKHLFIEAGTHARETINPAILVKMIEDYCKDFSDEEHLPDVDMKKILEGNVLHFVALTNPDGFDLVKADWKKEGDKKSNLRGVDLNRNYPSIYFDHKAMTFKSIADGFDKKKLPKGAKMPGKAYYPGKSPLTEPETKAVADYMLSYAFQGFISFHSQGHVVYHERRGMDDAYNERVSKIAGALAKKADYKVMADEEDLPTYGYLADYAAFETHKPAITVETMTAVSLDEKYYNEEEYMKVSELPLVLIKELEGYEYGDYRLYKDGTFIRDFETPEVAGAFAKRLGAEVTVAKGVPPYSIYENDLLATEIFITNRWPELADALTQTYQGKAWTVPVTAGRLIEAFKAIENEELKADEKMSEAQVLPEKYVTVGMLYALMD